MIEILVALVLAALIFLAFPGQDAAQRHRDLKAAVDSIDRSIRFAANESVLRNTVTRLRIDLEKTPTEYSVEYGPPGNIPLPEANIKASASLAEEKAQQDEAAALNKQFTKVEEFDDIKFELHPDVAIMGVATTSQAKLFKDREAFVYFYPTGEKDGAIIFFSTVEEIAYLEVQPFLTETNSVFEPLRTQSVAKVEDLLQTRMDEVYKEWISR